MKCYLCKPFSSLTHPPNLQTILVSNLFSNLCANLYLNLSLNLSSNVHSNLWSTWNHSLKLCPCFCPCLWLNLLLNICSNIRLNLRSIAVLIFLYTVDTYINNKSYTYLPPIYGTYQKTDITNAINIWLKVWLFVVLLTRFLFF